MAMSCVVSCFGRLTPFNIFDPRAIFVLNFHVTCLKNIFDRTACPQEGEQ
jgi:hypothetical protein